MALINDSRLFSGGYERLDIRPHVALYAQLKQREQARNDAYDEYVRGLNMRINPAGMRHNERPAFEDKLQKWQQYGMQNREALRNPRKDGGEAAMQFQAGYQDLQNLVARSKGAEELKKPAVEVMTDPNKFERANKEKMMGALQATDQDLLVQDPKTGEWVDNPNWRGFSISDIEFDDKPFEQDKFFKGLDDVKPSSSSEAITKNPKDVTQLVTTTSVFTPQDRDVIASRSVAEYGQNKSFKRFIDQLDPKEYNDIYKQAFGEDIQDKGDLAAAYALKGKQQQAVTKKVEDDKFAQAKALEGIRNANRRGLLQLRDSLKDDPAADDLWIDEYVDRVTTESKKPENRIEYKYKDGRKVSGYRVSLDPVLKNAIGFDSKNPGQFIITDDGDFIIAPFKTNEKYEIQKGADNQYAIDSENASRITQDQLKLGLGKKSAGVKQVNKEMNVPSPKGKGRTYRGLDANGLPIYK